MSDKPIIEIHGEFEIVADEIVADSVRRADAMARRRSSPKTLTVSGLSGATTIGRRYSQTRGFENVTN